MGVVVYLDTILVPLSLFFTLGYHAYLWHSFKNKPCNTTIGINTLTRRAWFRGINYQGDEKMSMLAVQSLRNTLMATTLTATIAILVNVALAALANSAFKASHLLNNPIFGSQTGTILVVKFGSASLLLLVSFLCSSMSIGYLIDANILINACGEFSSCPAHTQTILERGFMLALIANRLLCITFPLMLWLLGPMLVALSSVALIWGLYEIDFRAKLTN